MPYQSPASLSEAHLEKRAPTDPLREFHPYQSDLLFRRYGFTFAELIFEATGNLPTNLDPKMLWATKHPEQFPPEINRATRD